MNSNTINTKNLKVGNTSIGSKTKHTKIGLGQKSKKDKTNYRTTDSDK